MRGPNRQTPWARDPQDSVSVLRLALDTTDPAQRQRLEGMFSAMYSLRRALQRDARSRVDAYWAACQERAEKGPEAVRERLGLTRTALEHAAYRHLDRAPHLRRHATKALAMHMADSVWAPVVRHLFADASGRRQGRPRVGRWFDFTRIPGRARSHTRPRKWETFRLHGTLAGHRAAHTGTDGRFFEPRRMRPVVCEGDSWWSHEGALVVVFTGLPDGELALPVRLPSAPANQPVLEHHLSDPARWQKVDLVRRRDASAEGGWRYEAHLLVLTEPYVSGSTRERRERVAREAGARVGGIDVNVSNVTVASHVGGEDLRITRVERDAGERERTRCRARKERRRQRRLERSRRAANREQYELSERQKKQAQARAAAGKAPREHVIPRGPRKARADGKPLRAYGRDRLSASYRHERAAQAADASSAAQARREHARRTAAVLVEEHGFELVVEDCALGQWARRWGRALHAFSPGTLLSAIEREAEAVSASGGLVRVPTWTTALSQRCLCGEWVPKKLSDRVHDCPSCGLTGDRDAVSATLAAFVVAAGTGHAAAVDVEAARRSAAQAATRLTLRRTLERTSSGRQDAPSESTAPNASGGSSPGETRRTPLAPAVVARRIVGRAPRPTPDETGMRRTKPDRARPRTNLSRPGRIHWPRLRDSS